MEKTDALEALTVSLLRFEKQFLLLRRAENKAFAPGKWTGLGGHVEAEEYTRLRASALREVEEESRLSPSDITNYCLRRAVLVGRPRQPLRVLLYYTGVLSQRVTPACPEGTLFWKQEAEFAGLDIIETTRPVLPLLIQDMDADPDGVGLPVVGVAVFDRHGVFERVVWVNSTNE